MGSGHEAGPEPTDEEIKQAAQLVDQAEQFIDEVLGPGQWAEPEMVDRFLSEGPLERALGLYLRAIRLDPLEPAYLWNLASTLSRLGMNEVAFALIARAIRVAEQTGQKEWTGVGEHLALAEAALDAGQGDIRARGSEDHPELALADRLCA